MNWQGGVLGGFALILPWAAMVMHRLTVGADVFLPPVEIKATVACMAVALAAVLTRGRTMARTWQVVGLVAIAVVALAVFVPEVSRIGYASIALTATVSGLLMVTAQLLGRPVRVAAISSNLQFGPTAPAVEVLIDASLAKGSYDLLLISPELSQNPAWSSYIVNSACAGTRIESLTDHLERATGRVMIDKHCPEDLTRGACNARLWQATKRGYDIAIVMLMAPAALLFVAFGMLAILVTMGRPIFFAQDRVGKDGKVFRMFKLRTMRNRKEGEEQIATAVNDCRITPLGKALRRTHIDELPQLWNVLTGDMSMIGPRPEQPGLVEKYQSLLPNYAVRHSVRPGITGWSQTRFGYAETVEETAQKLEYDLYYIRNFGPRIDVSIAFRTVLVMFNPAHVR